MKKVLILGAAGRDFHNFNTYFRDNPEYRVVAFTATQIPDIEGRKYPAVLAGKLYPKGIPIYAESEMDALIAKHKVDEVHFAYSDVTHEYVMHKASQAMAAGADFVLLGPDSTMIKSRKPVVSVCAVRTGSGKSQTSRKVALLLKAKGRKVAAIRHPMPYGDLARQKVQRFAAYSDLDKHECTIEEREEYEPHIDNGIIIYSGVDYGAILEQAEKEADVILWDGGNNDFSFYRSDLEIVVADPHRAGHELLYHPGETNFRRADVIVINKINTAEKAKVAQVVANIRKFNPKAVVIKANSRIIVENGERIAGKRVLVIEDGPTLTHGGMKYGHRGRADVRRRRDHRPPALRRREHQEDVPEVQPPRQGPARNGLRREADRRAGEDDRQDRLRSHRQRDAHRHHPGPHNPPADPPRGLRARGDRFADPQGRPEGLLRKGTDEAQNGPHRLRGERSPAGQRARPAGGPDGERPGGGRAHGPRRQEGL
jgi:predicted GTPase